MHTEAKSRVRKAKTEEWIRLGKGNGEECQGDAEEVLVKGEG